MKFFHWPEPYAELPLVPSRLSSIEYHNSQAKIEFLFNDGSLKRLVLDGVFYFTCGHLAGASENIVIEPEIWLKNQLRPITDFDAEGVSFIVKSNKAFYESIASDDVPDDAVIMMFTSSTGSALNAICRGYAIQAIPATS